jgi:hypothetical protein
LAAFRFTSPDKEAIETLAAQYGGTPQPWDEPKASVQGQWEVFTEADTIDVLLPADDALSVWYEKWAGSGCERRCDGLVCTLPNAGPDGDDEEAACLCSKQGIMSCSVKTRLNVVLPGVNFMGVWRYESTSWAVADEMSAIEPILQSVQARGILRARLVLEQRSKITPKGKRNFTVTKLVLAATMEELASGMAGLPGIPVSTQQPAGALGTGKIEGGGQPGEVPPPSLDDDIVDAELVPTAGISEQERAWLGWLDIIEQASGLARDDIIRGLVLSATDGRMDALDGVSEEEFGMVCDKAEQLVKGQYEVTGVGLDGRLKVKAARA